MMSLFNRSMKDAPRDGQSIIVGHPDVGEFLMRWDPKAVNIYMGTGPGLWVDPLTGDYVWCEDEGLGPSYWRHLNS